MSRASAAANGLMLAVAQVAGLMRVPAFRVQSRVFTVVGAGGRQRPMYVGEWIDEAGRKRHAGMADWLLMPCIAPHYVTVPLWVEAKCGDSQQKPDQRDFQAYVEHAGAFYLLCRDPDALLEWFEVHGVRKS